MRPDAGTQAQFRKKKPPVTYRYDSSLSPALDWDGQNPAREQAEVAIRRILEAKTLEEAKRAGAQLKAISKPFLNWAGKAERLSFEVPTLPLFVHERLSTKAIIETLGSHKRDKQQTMFELFGDPQHSLTDQVLRAYEHRDKWVNRMILGDSLVVMNSLLHYEGLGGQVQMIYMDPPYGVKFGSNFQPFVRKRDVGHNDDEDVTREPEMVQAYRDTWELGLHSYLTYLRDRLLLARDLLSPSGSLFVQISNENLHHLRELLAEVFGTGNFCGQIDFATTTSQTSELLSAVNDHLLWYCRDRERVSFQQLFVSKNFREIVRTTYNKVELPDGTVRNMTSREVEDPGMLAAGSRILSLDNMTSRTGSESTRRPFEFKGQTFVPKSGGWKSSLEGLTQLAQGGRLFAKGSTLLYKRYYTDFPFAPLTQSWTDTQLGGYVKEEEKVYVVQTPSRVIERCILMTTRPGELVLDPTGGSGTTAYVAEQWGRRWITVDTSRVPLALARQRLLTATFPWYELKDQSRGPAGGFVYKRKQNNKGEEVGGIVPHVTLRSIANNEPPEEEVLVDRPEKDDHVTRVTGPFCVEATIPTPVSLVEEDEEGEEATTSTPAFGGDDRSQITDSRTERDTFIDRMLEVLRKSPVLRLEGNRSVMLRNIRPPAKTLSLSAEALVDANDFVAQGSPSSPAVLQAVEKPQGQKTDPALQQRPVALVFGPENGAIGERLVQEAGKEASLKNYTHLYVIGFAIQPNARQLIENCDAVVGIPATYIQATPDLVMDDLLKNMRSSQIFSVCGLPEIVVRKAKADSSASPRNDRTRYEVELLGLDVFDPVMMETLHRTGDDVPAWFLDTDYNGLCFHVSQAFFPRTGAWDSLKKALKGEYEESVWDHLSGTTSAPFEAGEQRQIAVKVIDDRGNELMVVEEL
jgi:adenine-specific DNA-methyltransferase